MIGALSGSVISRRNDTLVIDVQGVGYEVTVTAGVLESAKIGSERLSLVVFTDVKENAITLFGFKSALEREVFLLLRKVKGIGSRTALAIVSWKGPETVLAAIGRADVTALKKVPGVGTKTAERIIIELREVVGELPSEAALEFGGAGTNSPRLLTDEIEVLPQAGPVSGAAQDVVLALEKLGFPRERARQVVGLSVQAVPAGTKIDAGELLRVALTNL